MGVNDAEDTRSVRSPFQEVNRIAPFRFAFDVGIDIAHLSSKDQIYCNHVHPDEPFTGDFTFQNVDLERLNQYHLIKAVDSFDHQALDDPAFENSDLYRRLENLSLRLALQLYPTTNTHEFAPQVINQARETPEWEDAFWAIDENSSVLQNPQISANQNQTVKKHREGS